MQSQRQTLICPKCGKRSFWRLLAMRERSAQGPVNFAPAAWWGTGWWLGRFDTTNARFETFTCRGCGHTDWFALGLNDGDPASRVPPSVRNTARPRCDDCGQTDRWHVPEVTERGNGTDWFVPLVLHRAFAWNAGGLESYICAGCGWTDWYAIDLPRLRSRKGKAWREQRSRCARCPQTEAIIIETVGESPGWGGPSPFAVALEPRGEGSAPIGKFSLTICLACRYAEWTARDLGELKAAPHHGIELVDGAKDALGPYR